MAYKSLIVAFVAIVQRPRFHPRHLQEEIKFRHRIHDGSQDHQLGLALIKRMRHRDCLQL